MLVFNKKHEHIMTGERNPRTGLWYVPIPIPNTPTPPNTALPFPSSKLKLPQNHSTEFIPNHHPQHTWVENTKTTEPTVKLMNGIIKQDTPTSDLCAFHHAALFSPAPSTLQFAIKQGFLDSFPGLTQRAVKKYLPPSEATTKGHLDQEQQNIHPSKPKQNPQPPVVNDITTEDPVILRDTDNPNNLRTNNVMCTMFELTKKSYFDLTGKFPYTSSRGYKYIFVLYDYDSNAIFT
jgi:hypothetical protein